jgi:hypothetical protein
MDITIFQIIQLVIASGVLSQGIGMLKWSMNVENRLRRLEEDNPYDTRVHRKTKP